MTSFQRLVFTVIFSLSLASCSQSELNLSEESNPNYQRGRDFLRQGREEDAMDQFLKVLDELTEAPQTHLELGRLFLEVGSRKDPLQAIYHFRRFLRFKPDTREAATVEQLIATAEKQFLAGLPAKPFGDELDAMQLRERNQALEREVVRLKARLRLHEPDVVDQPDAQSASEGGAASSDQVPEQSTIVVPKQATYVVKAGDSLSRISQLMYGSSQYFDEIYQANRQAMPNKNSLRVGQKLIMPKFARP